MQPLEAALSSRSIFSALRPDEVGRIARQFVVLTMSRNATYETNGDELTARAIVVISGSVDVELREPVGIVSERLYPGDSWGDTALLTGTSRGILVTAREEAELGLLDKAALQWILTNYPAVSLPLAAEFAKELRARDDQVRRVFELSSRGLSQDQAQRALLHLQQSLRLRSVSVRRISARGLFRRLVIEHGQEPQFWMLVGFLLGLLGARIVVHLILKYRLEKQLFALVTGNDPNPVHIHHYNYGLLVVGLVGVFALSPRARNQLRVLSLAFGVGCGLIFDEFALFWNLNPDYTQGLSLISSAIAGVVLLQLVYFRRFWHALIERLFPGVGGK